MKTRIIILLTVLFSSNYAHAYSDGLKQLVQGKTYATKADSLNKVLVDNFMDKSKGTFWVTPQHIESERQYIYWQQAHAIDLVAYAFDRYEGTNAARAYLYKGYMNNWVKNHGNNYHHDNSDMTGFLNPYTDDMAWICLTLLHLSESLDNPSYAQTAKDVYDKYIITRAIRTMEGENEDVRLPWNWDKNPDGTYKNDGGACTDGSACLVAVKLHMRYGDEKYLADAIGLYNHMTKYVCHSDGRCEEPPLTYTQGTFGEACRLLYHVTGKATYKVKANLYLQYAIKSTSRCVYNGLLRNEGTSMDQSLFKGILIPYLANYILDEGFELTKRTDALKFLIKNADTMWNNLDKEAYPQMYCPYYWGDKYDASQPASMGAMVSGASLMENMARLQKAFDDEETGIEEIEDRNVEIAQSPSGVYDLNGRRIAEHHNVQSLKKGLYIVNGKKIFVK